MNKCIYLKTNDNLTFNSEEHIFLAALGGIKKLPKGYVSDYVNNNIFSPIELNVMRESILSINRMFIGPGKRGNLNKKNQTKSKIGVYKDNNDEENISLGYIKKGEPHQIPQLVVRYKEKKNCTLICTTEPFIKFLDNITNIENLKIINLYDKTLNDNEFIIGQMDHKIYMLTNKRIKGKYIEETIIEAMNQYNQKKYVTTNKNIQSNINLKMQFDIKKIFRVAAKIAFNYLASKNGQEYVLDKKFDKLRDFILGNKKKYNCCIMENIDMEMNFPSKSHKIFINKDNGYMYAVVNFYDEINIFIELHSKIQEEICIENKKIVFQDTFVIGNLELSMICLNI